VDLEVYAFDANIGGTFKPLTPAITNGSNNAINHLSVSADGNVLVGQRTQTSGDSGLSRATLNSKSDLFAVTNVHAALAGAAPQAFFLSQSASHGATVAFVGEGKGAQALFYSSAPSSADNSSWAERTLKVQLLQPGTAPGIADSVKSHYTIFTGGRVTDDDPLTAN
jgi:hypothetical protein